MSEKRLIERLKQSIVDCNEEVAKEVAYEIVKTNINPVKVIEEGIAPAAKIVGDRFESGDYFLVDLVMAGEAMQSASNVLMSGLSSEQKKTLEDTRIGTVIIAAVSGDIHDIGKNILGLLLKVNGFEVIDLGRDVDSMEIVERAREANVDIIALSALMTTTMPSQKDVIDILKAMDIRDNFIVMVGGGATTKEWADKIGANGWAATAVEASTLAINLVEKNRRL